MTEEKNMAEFGYQAMRAVAKHMIGDGPAAKHILANLKAAYEANEPGAQKMLSDLGEELAVIGRQSGALG